ncbi:transcription factor IIIB 50 kDa subunit [Genypterus blacodes]|uniref:transcription factor IIIB 50 kDa subunit n=1 Tax=Genypterus blacodes TaxID=154954 RepID=UPI003F76B5ED
MSSVCPECGSSNIVDEALYSQPQLVCADCGSVVSEGALVFAGTYSNYSLEFTTASKTPCRNLIKCLQRLVAICRILRVNSEIEELSRKYYKQAYEHKSFFRVSLDKKEILAGCCVLVSCQMLNWPITLKSISCLLDVDLCKVREIYLELIKSLNIEASLISITDVMESHAQEYKITSSHVPEEFAEEPKALTKRAMALVELAADSWIATGRRPVPLMMASIFLAWQSMNPSKVRRKCSLEKFCKLANVNKHKVASKRVTEIKEVLCKLGQEIPWIREELTPDSVVQQVEDILEYRFSLLRRALKTHEQALLEEDQASCEDSTPDLQAGGPNPELNTPVQVSHTPCLDSCQPDAEDAQQSGDGDSCGTSEMQGDNQETEAPKWAKRLLFAPPCTLKPKKRRLNDVNDVLTDITGYEEILDSDINQYIRTPREVRDVILAKEMLEQSEEKQ